jgi:Glycosyl hydrolase catalytic core
MRLALLCALALLLAAPSAHAAVPRDWLGVVADGPLTDPARDHDGEWDLVADSGAATVRTAFYWWDGQPAGPGAVDFTAYDRVVLAAARRGLGVVPVVHGTPQWARETPGDFASPPRDPADFGRFLDALVGRYGPSGSLWREHPEVRRRAIRDWQLWNEPNLTRYWARQPFARSYVRLLRTARAALRRADRRSRLILAGLPNLSWTALRTIYKAGGRRTFDAVAIHPYTGKPRNVVRLVEFARRVMRRYGDRRKPVWITELSWPAAKGKTNGTIGFETDDQGQARRLRAGLRLLARARKRLRIERVYWYTWLSTESGPSSFDWSGLRRLRGGEVISSPALGVFRSMARRLRR